MRKELAVGGQTKCATHLADAEVKSQYAAYVKRSQRLELQRLGQMFHRSGYLNSPRLSTAELKQAAQSIYYPEPFQPLNARFPHVAYCAVFEQIWCHAGYTRGELITSIALAPGEELTLEMHSWTKDSFKSERELAVESEVTLSNRLTARDHLEVVAKLATQTGIETNANVNVTIPVEGIPIGIGGGGQVSAALNTALDTTFQRTTESTTEAASALKSQRRLRIEVAREVGNEEKQLRKVANTNRCHTLNVHYFEVMSNFEVRTRLVEIIPCLLLPITEEVVTVDWVLCHEHLLKGGLLSRSYLPGSDAAKILATQAVLERLNEEAALAPTPGGTPGTPPTTTDPFEQEMADHRQAILRAYGDLKEVGEDHGDDIGDLVDALQGGDIISAGAVLGELVEDFPRLLALGALQLNRTTVSALNNLEESANNWPAIAALRSFFASVMPRDFKNVNPLGATFGKAMEELGFPETVTDILTFTWPELLQLVRDDAGLYTAVKAAHQRLGQIEGALRARDVEQQAGALFEAAAAGGVFAAPEAPFSPLQLAEAEVEFERLKCHIEEHRFHYFHLLWNSLPGGEAWRKVFSGLDCLLERRPIGFVQNKAAYPVQDTASLGRWLPSDDGQTDLKSFLQQLPKGFSDRHSAATTITLPTLGTVAEAILGQCCACEQYIIDSRAGDVRQQNAKAALDEARARIDQAEAQRREHRLAETPPDLSDPVDHAHGQLLIQFKEAGGNGT